MKLSAPTFAKIRQKGLTLVEIMIALLLGLFLIAGIGYIFLASKQSYRLNEGLSRLQEDGRFTMEILQTRLRSADYAGCYEDISKGTENVLNTPTNFAWDLTKPVEGFDNVAANATISTIATSSIAGTDVLVVKGMADSVPLATNPNATTLTIAAANNPNNRFANGQILLVTDCDHASVFQASSVATAGTVTTILHATGGMTPGNSIGNLSNLYSTDAEIGRLQTSMFNIENGANGRPALFERSLVVTGGITATLARNELIPNVENMQIVYGVDTDGDGDTDSYQSAAAVTDWRKVISVHIALLLTSEENNLVSTGETWTYNAATHTYDKTIAGSNRRFWRVVTGLIALRNRTL